MNKKIKMVLYGHPGVGKSVFALGAPKPFFLTTDGNYEWLDDFGAKLSDHKQLSSWDEAKKAFAQSFDGYDTIVVDLTEDLFKWCEVEYCAKSRIEHMSDIGFGKAYEITRTDFFIEISKLLAKDKHIILIMHGITYSTKDRRGVEHTMHGPTDRIPSKLIANIEGRVRYFLRCYTSVQENLDGELVKTRLLSLVPKENEFGICRGIDESKIPQDIELNFNTFAATIGVDLFNVDAVTDNTSVESDNVVNTAEPTTEDAPAPKRRRRKKSEIEADNAAHAVEQATEQVATTVAPTATTVTADEIADGPVVEVKKTTELSNADKIAAIKARLAKQKENNK